MSSILLRRFSAGIASMLVMLAGCRPASSSDIDLSLAKLSTESRYRVALQPPATAPRINELHRWQLRVTTPDGAPVLGAHFEVSGGMPEHGHGFPTQPRVTQELGNGTYVLDGMKFSMPGLWEITLAISAAPGADRVTFDTMVGTPHAARMGKHELRDRWLPSELEVLASMQLSRAGARPTDPSNAYEQNPAAATLGRALFEDRRMSHDGQVACATCHVASLGFQDGRPVGRGVGTGKRRTMPVMGASHSPFLFWDGRKDSLWSQALGPIEDPAEHGFNRTRVAALVRAEHAADYEKVFGPLPALPQTLPDASPNGTPAERAAWQQLPAGTRDDINRVFANVGKAIAAYESRINYGESAFDRYVAATLSGDGRGQEALSQQEVRGLRVFLNEGQCATCHNGPLLTDHSFHNTGVPPRDAAATDRGRASGVERLLSDEFNCLGRYSDARPEQCGELQFLTANDPRMVAAFRTPSLRNVAQRAPYMHAGQFQTLEQAVLHYARSPEAALGTSELARPGESVGPRKPIRLSDQDVSDVVAFLQSLSGPVIQPN